MSLYGSAPAVAVVLALAAAPLAGQTPTLAAPVYPGAVPEVEQSPPKPSQSRRIYYLTRDSLAQVTAFYDEAVSRRNLEMDRNRYDFQDTRHHWTAFTLREAFAITGEPLSENPSTQTALVIAEAVHPTSTTGGTETPNVVEQFFHSLNAVAQVGGAAPGAYDHVLESNRDLLHAYFPVVAWEGDRPVRADRAIFDRCEREVRPAGFAGPGEVPAPQELSEEEAAALAARIQQLYMQGKADEAQKLMMEAAGNPSLSMGDTGPAGALEMADQWVTCIEELRASAYFTRIRIDTHPSTWDWRANRH